MITHTGRSWPHSFNTQPEISMRTFNDSRLTKEQAKRHWRQVVLDAASAWIAEFPNVGTLDTEWSTTYFNENMPFVVIEAMDLSDATRAFYGDVQDLI
jgi:hypothetical protein